MRLTPPQPVTGFVLSPPDERHLNGLRVTPVFPGSSAKHGLAGQGLQPDHRLEKEVRQIRRDVKALTPNASFV